MSASLWCGTSSSLCQLQPASPSSHSPPSSEQGLPVGKCLELPCGRGRHCGRSSSLQGYPILKAQSDGLPSPRWKVGVGGKLLTSGAGRRALCRAWMFCAGGSSRWQVTSEGINLFKGGWQQNRGSLGSATAAPPPAPPGVSAAAPGPVRTGAWVGAEPREGASSPLRAQRLLSGQKSNPGAGFNSPTSLFFAFPVPRVPAAICPRRRRVRSPGRCAGSRDAAGGTSGRGQLGAFPAGLWVLWKSKMEQLVLPWVGEAGRGARRG